MARRDRYAELDNLTPEQVRDFKRGASAPAAAPQRAGARREQRLIVAEGDSWFDYPLGTDIIDCLRKFHGYTVINRAKAGDTLENMIYGTKFNPREGYRALPRSFHDVLADLKEHRPRAFLFSGGGNDIAGEEFAQFLEHAGTGLEPFRRAHALHVIDVFFRRGLERMIEEVSAAAPGVQIFTHGYGYPVPDGRGIGIAIGLSFIGPWLRPALAAKRIDHSNDGVRIIRELIGMFNDLLASLQATHANFHYIDLRGVVGEGARHWVNELHVRNSVYARIADAFHERMIAAGVWRKEGPIRPQRLGATRGRGKRAASGRAQTRPRAKKRTKRSRAR